MVLTIDIAVIWRIKMNDYQVCSDEKNGIVNISIGKCNYLDSFLSIFVDDENEDIVSPFKDIEDAEVFAEIVVKLLKVVCKDD